MSFEAIFVPRTRALARKDFFGWFAGRANWRIAQEHGRFFYDNADTGVYFSVACGDSERSDAVTSATVSINCLRADFFIAEAEPEVSQMVADFDLACSPDAGQECGPFRAESFRDDWRRLNASICAASLDGKRCADFGMVAAPRAKLDAAWRWNVQLPQLRGESGEARYLPPVRFALVDGAVASLVIWPDGARALLPRVDYLLIWRERLAPPRLFRKSRDAALLAVTEATDVLRNGASEHEIETFLQALPAAPMPHLIPADRLLDMESLPQLASATG